MCIRDSINEAFAKVQDDLIVAESVQRRYLPSLSSTINGICFAGAFEPAFHTAGDIFNYIRLNDDEIAAFSVDVSGHGVASSLMAVTIADALCVKGEPQPILLDPKYSDPVARDPAAVVEELNSRFINGETDHYFTFAYCVINMAENRLRFCQAGHPPLLIVREEGDGEELGAGGMPVGMFDGVSYETYEAELRSNDRVYLFSDGIPETENEKGDQFTEDNMLATLASSSGTSLEDSIEFVVSSARAWQPSEKFADDVSILSLIHISEPTRPY